MTNFFATEDTVTIHLDDQHYVEIKRELDYGEEGDLEGAAISAEVEAGTGTPKLEFSLRALRTLKLALYITEWNLTGTRDKPIPLPDNLEQRQALIARLSPRWAKIIADKIDALRAEDGAPEAIKVEPEPNEHPTSPGAVSAPGTPSPLPNGSDAPIETFSGRRIG